MEKVRISIHDNNNMLLNDCEAWIEVGMESGLQTWRGHFDAPAGMIFSLGGPFRLKINDGRAGDILITHVGIMSSKPCEVRFLGTGPFGKSST